MAKGSPATIPASPSLMRCAVVAATCIYAPSIWSNSTGRDLRFEPPCRAVAAPSAADTQATLILNAQYEHDGPVVYEHACLLGCEGVVSKRKNSRYRSGRSRDWVKTKNPAAPAVKREAEEDWGKGKWR
jgi:hypothetical protein